MPILSFSICDKLDENLYDNSMCMRIVFEILWKYRLYTGDILLDVYVDSFFTLVWNKLEENLYDESMCMRIESKYCESVGYIHTIYYLMRMSILFSPYLK